MSITVCLFPFSLASHGVGDGVLNFACRVTTGRHRLYPAHRTHLCTQTLHARKDHQEPPVGRRQHKGGHGRGRGQNAAAFRQSGGAGSGRAKGITLHDNSSLALARATFDLLFYWTIEMGKRMLGCDSWGSGCRSLGLRLLLSLSLDLDELLWGEGVYRL